MKNQRKSALAYMFRNFWRLIPFSLPIAVVLGFFLTTSREMTFFRGLAEGTMNSNDMLTELMGAFTVMRFGKLWWGVLVAIVLFALTESLLTIKVSQHMRTGEMPLFPVKKAIPIFPTMLLFVVAVSLIMEIFNLIVAGLALLISGGGTTLVAVVSGILIYFVRAFVTWMVGMLLFAFPIMFLENYSFHLALSYSARLMAKKRRFLLFATLFYTLCRFFISAICYIVNIDAVTYALFGVFYLFLTVFLPSFAFCLYYDTVGGDRRDLTKTIW